MYFSRLSISFYFILKLPSLFSGLSLYSASGYFTKLFWADVIVFLMVGG